MKMVQRKAPNKLGIQADLIITSRDDHHLHHQNRSSKPSIYHSQHHQDGKTRKPEVKRKMMKKSRSFKSPPSPKTPPPPTGAGKIAETLPKNYMKSTSCFEARKSTSGGKKTAATKSSLTTTKTRSFKKRAGLFGGHVAEVQRATCSSTLKDSKFPSFLELSRGGTESEGVSAVKVCPYTYCSLNGHLHKHASLPPLKRFLSGKRRALSKSDDKVGFFVELYAEEEQEQVVLESVSDDEPPRSDEEESSAGELEDERFEAEKENVREEEIVSSNLFVGSTKSNEETMEIEDEEESFCFGLVADPPLCWDEDGCGNSSEEEAEESDVVEDIEESFEVEEDQSDKGCSEANGCQEIASSNLSQSNVVEESSNLEIVDDEDTNEANEIGPSSDLNDEIASSDLSQSCVLEESSNMEIINDKDANEANENCPCSGLTEEITSSDLSQNSVSEESSDPDIVDDEYSPSSDASEESSNHDIIEIEIDHDSGSGRRAKKQRDSLEDEEELRSKWKRSKREAEDSEGETERGFNPRGPNFLELTLEAEGERVDLKHQEAEERKTSEEWMIDRALQRTVNELGQRKRRVALLVEAFETVTPVTIRHEPAHRINHYRHIPSSPVFQYAICPLQACN